MKDVYMARASAFFSQSNLQANDKKAEEFRQLGLEMIQLAAKSVKRK